MHATAVTLHGRYPGRQYSQHIMQRLTHLSRLSAFYERNRFMAEYIIRKIFAGNSFISRGIQQLQPTNSSLNIP